jgi:hypothetical protein
MRRLLILVATVGLLGEASPVTAQGSLRVEAGLGFSGIGSGGGPTGRLAVGGTSGKWGALFRYQAHDGGELKNYTGFFGKPSESFTEGSLLLTRSVGPGRANAALIGVGVGMMSGRRIDSEGGSDFVDIDGTWGLALEAAVHTGDGHGLGVALMLSSHLNSEASQVGVSVAITLGWASRG